MTSAFYHYISVNSAKFLQIIEICNGSREQIKHVQQRYSRTNHVTSVTSIMTEYGAFGFASLGPVETDPVTHQYINNLVMIDT